MDIDNARLETNVPVVRWFSSGWPPMTFVPRFPFLFPAFLLLLPCYHHRVHHFCCISPPLFEVPYKIKSTIFPWLGSSRSSDYYNSRNLGFIMSRGGGSPSAWCQGGRPPSDLQELNFDYTICCNTRPSMPCPFATCLQTISCFLRLTVFSPNANTCPLESLCYTTTSLLRPYSFYSTERKARVVLSLRRPR